MTYIQRHAEEVVKERFQTRRALYLFGARQTGKTTLLKQLYPDARYVSLETPTHREFAQTDPIGFLNQFDCLCILDEVQRVPELFAYLQEYIDIKEQRFILTGSQNFLMMESITQSLAGRVTLLELPPLSQSEIQKRDNLTLANRVSQSLEDGQRIDTLLFDIVTGFYPEVRKDVSIAYSWHEDYIRTFVERDVRLLINVKDLSQFQRFLALCAGRAGQLLNISSLANDLGMSTTTCRQWLSILEQSGVIYLLRPYSGNINKRVVKSPKLYFSDTGILCHLIGIHEQEVLKHHPLVGSIIENYVINECRKAYLNSGINPNMTFFRDSNGVEVDLIIEDKSKTYAVEIKSTQTVKQSTYSSLVKWKALHPHHESVLVYGGEASYVREGISVISMGSM